MSVAAPSPFRHVPKTGVIYVTEAAAAYGYMPGDSAWVNLGQGQPETGTLAGAPPRIGTVAIDPADHEYAPVSGIWGLREAVAGLYNRLFRRGMPSQYSAENVSISGGGRAALTRAVASLDNVNLGHFIPDYTAYEELLDVFRLVSPVPIFLSREDGYSFTGADMRREIAQNDLGALLASNPANPVGKVVAGQQLADWVEASRETGCALLLDEFYSHFILDVPGAKPGSIVSAAAYVEDVDKENVVIVDGLTKNWRYPGWRVAWTVGPRKAIETVSSAGSFLDGGGNRPLQQQAIELMDERYVAGEARAIYDAFRPKRDLMLARARAMGMGIDPAPQGTFYAFASLEGLPESLSDGMRFFKAALERKVLCVPGPFFDVNPGHRRDPESSPLRQYVRLSFGPRYEDVERGLARLEEMVRDARG